MTAARSPVAVHVRVEGMSCGACAARVERALNGLPGTSARVNLAAGDAWVHLDGGEQVAAVIDAVNHLGYTAQIADRRGAARRDPAAADAAARRHLAGLRRRFLVALALCAPLADLSISLAVGPSLRFPGWRFVLLALAAPLATWCAWPFYRVAAIRARHRTASMETLISLGVLSATAWSVYAMWWAPPSGADRSSLGTALSRPSGSVYLDVVAAIVTFGLAGRVLEALAQRRSGRDLRALVASYPSTVRLLDGAGDETRLPAEAVAPGDRFAVGPGDVVAADGRVLEGRAAMDTRSLRGESLPVEVGPGDDVLAGMMSVDGRLVVGAVRAGADTTLAHLVETVERGTSDKAQAQRLADRVCAVFVPAVLALSAATLGGWLSAGASANQAVDAALAVLVVACPCALGLATPVALLVAGGAGARRGIFLKHHRVLERAKDIDTVVFDKTGTLTGGRLTVMDMVAPGGDPDEVLGLAAAVQGTALRHPVAAAIVAACRQRAIEVPFAEACDAAPGAGVSGKVDGRRVIAGSSRFLAAQGVAVPPPLLRWQASVRRRGQMVALVAVDGVALGGVALADAVNPSAAPAVAELRRRGIRTVLATGDGDTVAGAVGEAVRIDETVSGLLPDDKVALVAALGDAGRSVAMVGDGVNDGPALATADLGLAVAASTPLAVEAADVVLTTDDLTLVPAALTLARSTLRTIRGNLLWAFAYNAVALPLAAAGRISPLLASGAMALSSMLVLANSLRLQRFGTPPPAPNGRRPRPRARSSA